jgi:hypothetical protein
MQPPRSYVNEQNSSRKIQEHGTTFIEMGRGQNEAFGSRESLSAEILAQSPDAAGRNQRRIGRKRTQKITKKTNKLNCYRCILRTAIRLNHACSRGFFSRRERGERGATAGKGFNQVLFLRALCDSARSCSIRQGLDCGAVPGRGMLFLEKNVLNRRKQREQSIRCHCPSFRFLCGLLFEARRRNVQMGFNKKMQTLNDRRRCFA